eukprot:4736678-Prymnesium_polylepis.1
MPAIVFVSRRLSPVQAVLPMTALCSSRGRRTGRPGGDAPVSEADARGPWAVATRAEALEPPYSATIAMHIA